MATKALLQAIAATAELCGKVYTPAAAAMFAQDLAGFNESAVMAALTRCRKELDGKPFNVAAVISRIDDGRPSVEQAWAMLPHDEETSAVLTEEMAQAWGVARPLLNDGDKIGARMAFKEVYAKLLADARDQKVPPKWFPSLGRDVGGRQTALMDAVRHNRLSLGHAVGLLPNEAAEGLLMSLGVKEHPLLAAPSKDGKKRVGELLLLLNKKVPHE
jgi:hypothetical protein